MLDPSAEAVRALRGPQPLQPQFVKASRLPVLLRSIPGFRGLWTRKVPETHVQRTEVIVVHCACGRDVGFDPDFPVSECACDRWFLLEDGLVFCKRWSAGETTA